MLMWRKYRRDFKDLEWENAPLARSVVPQPRRNGVVRGRALFQSQLAPTSRLLPSWCAVEILALIMFILLHNEGSMWHGRQGDSDFLDNATEVVQTFARVDHLRAGKYKINVSLCAYYILLYG